MPCLPGIHFWSRAKPATAVSLLNQPRRRECSGLRHTAQDRLTRVLRQERFCRRAGRSRAKSRVIEDYFRSWMQADFGDYRKIGRWAAVAVVKTRRFLNCCRAFARGKWRQLLKL